MILIDLARYWWYNWRRGVAVGFGFSYRQTPREERWLNRLAQRDKGVG